MLLRRLRQVDGGLLGVMVFQVSISQAKAQQGAVAPLRAVKVRVCVAFLAQIFEKAL